MRLNQVQYIIEVAKYHSFSKAAKKLFVAQPSLSTSISALEEELGVTIFHRTSKGAFLTEDGEKILAQAEQVLAAVEKMTHVIDNDTRRYTVSVAATPVACNSLTTKLLKKLSVSNPEILLNIIEMRPLKILSTLTDGIADIVIGSYSADRKKSFYDEAHKNNLHIEPLMTDSLYAFVSRSHPATSKKCVFLHELEKEHQAVFRDYLFIGEEKVPPFEEIDTKNCYTFSDRSSIKQAVAAELAYAIFPHQMVLDDIFVNSGLIRALPLADNDTEIITYVAWRKSAYTPKQELLVLDYIRALYTETEERLNKLTTYQPDKNVERSATIY